MTNLSNSLPTAWSEHEIKYAANFNNGCASNTLIRVYGHGCPLLLSSLHGVNHFRQGSIKKADRRTGGLVDTLCAIKLADGLIATQLDPLLEPETHKTPFEQKILAWTDISNKLICDIHAAHPKNDFDLCLGTGPGMLTLEQEALCAEIEQAAQHVSFLTERNRPNYSALIPQALTRRLKERGVRNIVQIEINARLLNESNGRDNNRLLELFLLLAARLGRTQT